MKSSKNKIGKLDDKKKTKFDDDYMFTSSEDSAMQSVSSYKGTSGEIFEGGEKEIKKAS